MNSISINKHNVGRIAERIVSNELESRGFRVSDLNKEGTSANADLLAAKDGKTWQIQVKGATHTSKDGWWVNYGFCDDAIIDGQKEMFNVANSFYKAEIVVLVCVKGPAEYRCVVFPLKAARDAVKLNLDYAYRTLNKDGSRRKPGRLWVSLDYIPRARDPSRIPLLEAEQKLVKQFDGNWNFEDTATPSSNDA